MKNMYGQTLVELMSCAVIISIVLTSAMAYLPQLLNTHKQTQAVNQLVGALHYARAVAVLERKTVALCPGKEKCETTKNWQGRLLTFVDSNQNGQLDNDERLLQQLTLQTGYDWQWSSFRSRPYVQFEADGTTRALNGTFTLCYQSMPTKQVIINLTGRARTQMPPIATVCK